MKRYCIYALLSASSFAAVPHLVRFSGVAKDAHVNPATGVVGIHLALYAEQTGGAPLWMETQNVQPGAGGHYNVLLGATRPEGLPADLFQTGQARWLGTTIEGQTEQPRVLLVSAPYALQAGDAETVGGLPPSAFVRAAPAAVTAAAATSTKPEAARDVSPDTKCKAITSDGTATAGEVVQFTGPCAVEPSAIFESGGNVGIGTATPAATLDVNGTATIRGALTMNAKGVAKAAAGAGSNPLDLLAASFDSATHTSTNEHFRWQAEAAGNDTASPSGTLNLLYAPAGGTPAETGLAVTSAGLFTFAAGQTFLGVGSITGVAVGAGLAGGGTAGNVSVGLTSACANRQILEWNGSTWACATMAAGTITSVTAGAGLSGGGPSGSVTLTNTGVLAVGAGTGITSSGGNAPTISLKTGFTDGRYLKLAGGALSGALTVPANGLMVAGNQLVLAGGNVGIGTATPSAPLEVDGSVKISGSGSALTFPDGTTQATAGNPAGVAGVNPLQVALLKWFPAYQTGATFSVGNHPAAVAFDGANIWVGNCGANNVNKLLASTGAVLGTFAVGSCPAGLAFDGANIWVANTYSNNVTKLAAATGAVVGTYSAGTEPGGLVFDGANIWVSNFGSGTMTKLLASNGMLQGTYTVGNNPSGVAFDGAHIWVTNWGDGTVTKLLASTGALEGTYNVGMAPLAIAFDGANIWVANSASNNVTKLLASSGATVGTYTMGDNPGALAFDGADIWVANFTDGTVNKVLTATGALLGTYFVGAGPDGLAFDGANIWVANENSNTMGKL